MDFVFSKWDAIIVDDPNNWSSAWSKNLMSEIRIVLSNDTPEILKVLGISKAEAASTIVQPSQILGANGVAADSDQVLFGPLRQ